MCVCEMYVAESFARVCARNVDVVKYIKKKERSDIYADFLALFLLRTEKKLKRRRAKSSFEDLVGICVQSEISPDKNIGMGRAHDGVTPFDLMLREIPCLSFLLLLFLFFAFFVAG